jgi:cellobiose phosphorylase
VAANGNNALEPADSALLYADIKKKLQVQGNIWYISQSLSKLKQVDKEITEELWQELSTIQNILPDKVIEKEHCTVYALDIYDLIKQKLHHMSNSVRDYIIELRNKFYPPGSGRYSDLGVPLLIFDVLK